MAGAHSMAKAQPADLVANCCSGLETAPCPHTLQSTSEFKDHAASAVAPDVRPATVKIASPLNNEFMLTQSHAFLAARRSPQFRGSGVPIYLFTETFLI